jgi:hypothetical protein
MESCLTRFPYWFFNVLNGVLEISLNKNDLFYKLYYRGIPSEILVTNLQPTFDIHSVT